jgi:hypothetical protein
MLLASNFDELMEDLKGAAEASRYDAESLAGTARSATVMEFDDDEVPFWERDFKHLSQEEETKYELDQAVWRFRKYLRNRFGSAQKAWAALEGARTTVDGDKNNVTTTRMADTLSISEIKIALSRVGIKLPHVTAFDKIKQLFNSMDLGNTGYLTYKELLGDEEKDLSLLADPPPAAREPWQNDLEQPRWMQNWETGYFDKDMLECIVSRDYFRPTKEAFKSKNNDKKMPEGYIPVWQKYQQVLEQKNRNREALMQQKEDKEFDNCTFKPDMAYSSRMAKKILNQKKKQRAMSQPMKSVHESNMEKMKSHEKEQEGKCTFCPQINEKSRLIYSHIHDTGKGWWHRLSKEDHHDRLNHITYLTQEAQAMFSSVPDISGSADYGIHHKRRGPIHERLFHHEKHAYWHGHERGIPADDEAKRSLMPEWARYTPSDSSIQSPMTQSSPLLGQMPKATPSTRQQTPADNAEDAGDGPKGEITVEYKNTLLGMMEACERWGSRMDDETQDLFAKAQQGTTLRTPGRSPSPQENFTPGSYAASTPGGARLVSSARGAPNSNTGAKARGVTPPARLGPASARSKR